MSPRHSRSTSAPFLAANARSRRSRSSGTTIGLGEVVCLSTGWGTAAQRAHRVPAAAASETTVCRGAVGRSSRRSGRGRRSRPGRGGCGPRSAAPAMMCTPYRSGDLRVAVELLDDEGRALVQLARLRVAAVVEVSPEERVLFGEDEADPVASPPSSARTACSNIPQVRVSVVDARAPASPPGRGPSSVCHRALRGASRPTGLACEGRPGWRSGRSRSPLARPAGVCFQRTQPPCLRSCGSSASPVQPGSTFSTRPGGAVTVSALRAFARTHQRSPMRRAIPSLR